MARIVFAGSPAFVLPYLEWLESSQHQIIAVYTQPDRAAGRGRQVIAGPVKAWAQQHNTPVYQPSKWDQETINGLAELKADILLVVAYGIILPAKALSAPKIDCLNIHYSLLPRWRGAAPVIHALLAGDNETGACLMRMEKGLDTGPVYANCKTSLTQAIAAGELTEKLTTLGVNLLEENLAKIISAELAAVTQASTGANYASKINKNMAVIDWHKPAAEILRKIAAFNPWPIAQSCFENKTLRIGDAELTKTITKTNTAATITKTNTAATAANITNLTSTAKAGCILTCNAENIEILCGDGNSITLKQVQLPGKKMQPIKEFINANKKNIEPMITYLGN